MRIIVEMFHQFKKIMMPFIAKSGEIEAKYRKSRATQLMEIAKMRLGPGKLEAEDYYLYELYDDSQYTKEEKYTFISPGALPDKIWARRSAVLADDKAIFYLTMSALGHETPAIYSFLHPVREFGGYCSFKSARELICFLEEKSRYPLVVKPIRGIFSKDVIAISNLDSNGYALINGETVSSRAMCDFVVSHCADGLIIQELLKTHENIENLCGPRLSTLRLLVLCDSDGPRIFHALWKIASKKNMADNFWREGNYLASIDLDSGRVVRCVTGYSERVQEISEHQETEKRLIGFQIPDWDLAKNICIQAGAALPGFPMQAWDVALTDRGPVLLEVNIVGSLFLPQLASKEGLLTDDFKAFLAEL